MLCVYAVVGISTFVRKIASTYTPGPVLPLGEARPIAVDRHGALAFDVSKIQRRPPMVRAAVLKDKGHDAFNRDAKR